MISRPALWVAGAAILAAGVLINVQGRKLADARAALATEQRDRAAERAIMERYSSEQLARFRATEHNWHEVQDENARLARMARDRAALDAASAGAAGQRLRERASTLAACSGPAGNPAAVAAGPAASAPGDVLADMLGRLESAGRIVAEFADAAAINGEQCAADYQALRKGPAKAPDGAMAH